MKESGPKAAPVPNLAGAPDELVAAVQGLASRMGAAEPKLIDAARFAELASLGDPSLVRHVTDTFFSTVPAQVSKLRDAVASGDATAVRGFAHTIKGGAASAGFPAASESAAALEDAARAGEAHRFEALFARLDSALSRTRVAVDDHLG